MAEIGTQNFDVRLPNLQQSVPTQQKIDLQSSQQVNLSLESGAKPTMNLNDQRNFALAASDFKSSMSLGNSATNSSGISATQVPQAAQQSPAMSQQANTPSSPSQTSAPVSPTRVNAGFDFQRQAAIVNTMGGM